MTVVAMFERYRQIVAAVGRTVARLTSVVAALLFAAATQSTAFAQQSQGLKARIEPGIAKMALSAYSTPIASSPKAWELQYVLEWVEVCHEESYPGYTDRDWDTYTVCEWELIEVPEWVWVDDPEECPAAAPNTPQSFGTPPSDPFKAAVRSAQIASYRKADHTPGYTLGFAASRTYQTNPGRRSAFATLKMGAGWYGEWDRSVNLANGGNKAYVTRGDGSELVFKKRLDGTWQSQTDTTYVLVEFAANPYDLRWQLRGQNTVESFNQRGSLRSLARPGESYQLGYSNVSGTLETVTDFRGRALRLEYDTEGYVSQLIDADDGVTTFKYEDGLLVAAYYPNGKWREFSYDPSGKLTYSPLRGGSSQKSRGSSGGTAALPATPTAGSCPTPCETWMRLEIGQCISEADQRRVIRERDCTEAYLARLDLDPTVAGRALAEIQYTACLVSSEYTYIVDVLTCRGRYPQCFP